MMRLRSRCTKWDVPTQAAAERGLYDAVDRTASGIQIGRPVASALRTFSPQAGGVVDSNGTTGTTISFGTLNIATAGSYTVLYRQVDNQGLSALRVKLTQGGTSDLAIDGTWSSTAVTAVPSGVSFLNAHRHRAIAITFFPLRRPAPT